MGTFVFKLTAIKGKCDLISAAIQQDRIGVCVCGGGGGSVLISTTCNQRLLVVIPGQLCI